MKDCRLRRGEQIRLDGNAGGNVISCREGILWLTQTGNPGDHLVLAGETFRIAAPGRIVIGALADSFFIVKEERAPSRLFAGMLPRAVRQAVRCIDVARRRLWT